MQKQAIEHRCPVCGQTGSRRPVAQMGDKYVALKCEQCQLTCAHPIPSLEELHNFYSNYHVTQETPERLERLVGLHSQILDYLLSRLEKQAPTFLDYGFGVGAFLKLVHSRNLAAYGVEFSQQNCEQMRQYCAKNQAQIAVVQLPEQSLDDLPCRQFDCITLFQVVEHLADPVALLSSLSRYQARGGLLYIECPNHDALFLQVKNKIRHLVDRTSYFGSLYPPEHLLGFNRRSLRVLLEQAGYELVDSGDYAFADGFHQPETSFWYPSVVEVLSNRTLWQFYFVAKASIGLIDPLASRLFGAGGGLYALARKVA